MSCPFSTTVPFAVYHRKLLALICDKKEIKYKQKIILRAIKPSYRCQGILCSYCFCLEDEKKGRAQIRR